jgi:hypothetical protein
MRRRCAVQKQALLRAPPEDQQQQQQQHSAAATTVASLTIQGSLCKLVQRLTTTLQTAFIWKTSIAGSRASPSACCRQPLLAIWLLLLFVRGVCGAGRCMAPAAGSPLMAWQCARCTA